MVRFYGKMERGIRFDMEQHYDYLMPESIKIAEIVEDYLYLHNGQIESLKDEAYDLLKEGYTDEEAIDILCEKYENYDEEDEETTSNGGLDPAFASWEECNRQFV